MSLMNKFKYYINVLWVFFVGASCYAKSDIIEHVKPSIRPELKEHTKLFEKKIYQIADTIYSAVGWHVANTIIIEGEKGLIIFDVGQTVEGAQEIKADIRKRIPDKPVKAIIYSHFHPDHIFGVKGWVSQEEVDSGEVKVIAQESLLADFINQTGMLSPILSIRSAYSFGIYLSSADMKDMNAGIGPCISLGTSSFIAPTQTFSKTLDITIEGIHFHLVSVPSEAADEIIAYLPQKKVLLSAEVIQGPAFPNIYTLRGTEFRSPVSWFKSIDLMRSFHAEYCVPSHGLPIIGVAAIEDVFQHYRDAIQFVHDQTVRYMNKGLTPLELANVIELPDHLRSYKPYLQEFYGTVSHSVKEIYAGYLGWFQGDPVDLNPTAGSEKAKRLIKLMGGRKKLIKEARSAFDKDDFQWAAELATYLISSDNNDQEARTIKAAAFKELGYNSININWRNWYLSAADELEGIFDKLDGYERIPQVPYAPQIIAAFPVKQILELFTVNLKAENTLTVTMTMGFVVKDTADECGLEIRRGVAQFHDKLPQNPNATIAFEKKFLQELLQGKTDLMAGLDSGALKITKGTLADVAKFFGYFEVPGRAAKSAAGYDAQKSKNPIHLIVR